MQGCQRALYPGFLSSCKLSLVLIRFNMPRKSAQREMESKDFSVGFPIHAPHSHALELLTSPDWEKEECHAYGKMTLLRLLLSKWETWVGKIIQREWGKGENDPKSPAAANKKQVNLLPWMNSNFLLTDGRVLLRPRILSRWKANTSLMSRGCLRSPQGLGPQPGTEPEVLPSNTSKRVPLLEIAGRMLATSPSARRRILRMSSLLSHEGALSL